jgi:hypothetical protein
MDRHNIGPIIIKKKIRSRFKVIGIQPLIPKAMDEKISLVKMYTIKPTNME